MSLFNQSHSPYHILLPNNLSSDFCSIDLESWFKIVLFWLPMGRAGLLAMAMSFLLVAMVKLEPGYM